MTVTIDQVKKKVGKNTVDSFISLDSLAEPDIQAFIDSALALYPDEGDEPIKLKAAIEVIDAIDEPDSYLKYSQAQRSVDPSIIQKAISGKRALFQKQLNDEYAEVTELDTSDMVNKEDTNAVTSAELVWP